MSLESLVEDWKQVREGLIEEVNLIPADKLEFRATGEARTVAEVILHIVTSQKLLVGESCRPDTNLFRAPFPELIKLHAGDVAPTSDKATLLAYLRGSMEDSENKLRSFGEVELSKTMKRFDGKEVVKLNFLQFSISHEMYHRGQLTVYERLLNIEPALTTRFKKLISQQG